MWIKSSHTTDWEQRRSLKKLAKYIHDRKIQIVNKYHRPDLEIYPPVPESVRKYAPQIAPILEKSSIVFRDNSFDLRVEYSGFLDNITAAFLYTFCMISDTPNASSKSWHEIHFKDIYPINRDFFWEVGSEALELNSMDFLLRTISLWEYTLRTLADRSHGKVFIPYVKGDGEVKAESELEKKSRIPAVWRSVYNFLELNNSEYDKLFKITNSIRNTIHNYHIHKPTENHSEDSVIEYKGVKYEFRSEYALNFLRNENIAVLVKDSFDLMMTILEHEKFKSLGFISGYYQKGWYGI